MDLIGPAARRALGFGAGTLGLGPDQRCLYSTPRAISATEAAGDNRQPQPAKHDRRTDAASADLSDEPQIALLDTSSGMVPPSAPASLLLTNKPAAHRVPLPLRLNLSNLRHSLRHNAVG